MNKFKKYNILLIIMELLIVIGSICNIISKSENEVLNIIHIICVLISVIIGIILLINLKKIRSAAKSEKEENSKIK